MKSQLLESIGLGNIDIAYIMIGLLILILILFILLIVSMVKQSKLKKRYEAFMQGSDAQSMESQIAGLFQDIDTLKKDTKDNGKEIRHIYKRLETVFQKIGIVKYDAFKQMGGQLSYSLALLDEGNNGIYKPIPYTVQMAAILIQRKSKRENVKFLLGKRNSRHSILR